MHTAIMLVCLAGGTATAQRDDAVFTAPLIQVKTGLSGKKDYLYLLHNRVYMARNYQKPTDKDDYGNPDVDFSRLATTYYHDKSPIGVVLQKYNWFPGKGNTYHADARLPVSMIGMGLDSLGQLVNLWSEPPIAVLGMDAGTLASYARPGQTMHFTERVPEFIKLSFPEKGMKPHFHFAQDALARGAALKVFAGEPRELMEKISGDQFYQVMVIGNFKLPVSGLHKELMTKEAMKLLMGKVRDDGILCFHTSNRYYDLVPILASAAKELKYACAVGHDAGEWGRDQPGDYYRYSSEWVMVARHEKHLAHLKPPADLTTPRVPFWSRPAHTDKKFVWKDDGMNLFHGVYRSDPEIDKLYDVLNDAEDIVERIVGTSRRSMQPVTNAIRDAIRTASANSARSKNGGALMFEKKYAKDPIDRVVFRAPLIEVMKDHTSGSDYLYLMHNGTYIGRNYQKPDPFAKTKDFSRLATTYFHDLSPLGVVLGKFDWFPLGTARYHADARLPASIIGMGLDPFAQLAHLWSEPPIGVVGMDVGTIASYARPGQAMDFFEHVPEFIKLSLPDAEGPPTFHYISDAIQRGAAVKIIAGEPRASFEKHGRAGYYQLIAINTYKIAVTTVHKGLMTKEGMKMLMSKTRDDGSLCYHTSNRYYELAPIIASTAKDLGYAAIVGTDSVLEWVGDPDRDRFNSQWVMVARKAEDLAWLKEPKIFAKAKRSDNEPYWGPPNRVEKKFVWTDAGENTFRGLYRSDPSILEFSRKLSSWEQAVSDRTGFHSYPYTRGVYGLLESWSRSNAAAMNRDEKAIGKDEKK